MLTDTVKFQIGNIRDLSIDVGIVVINEEAKAGGMIEGLVMTEQNSFIT